jgi:hypothetical protein
MGRTLKLDDGTLQPVSCVLGAEPAASSICGMAGIKQIFVNGLPRFQHATQLDEPR